MILTGWTPLGYLKGSQIQLHRSGFEVEQSRAERSVATNTKNETASWLTKDDVA